jgi:GT2 family glycosyltransferase
MSRRAVIAVVAYNDATTLGDCVRSLRASTPDPIVIVDNASDDATASVAAELAATLERVTVSTAEANRGYAAAAGIAWSGTDAEYVGVTNADCTFTGDWVAPLVAFLDAHPDHGAASPTVLLSSDGAINAEGLDIHKAGFGFNRHLGRDRAAMSTVTADVPGVQGTAFIARTQAIRAIGGWYDGGFLYHEDVELSWSLRLAGFRIAHVPSPPITHDYTLTMSPEKFFLLERNRIEMLDAVWSIRTKLAMSPVVVATEAAVWWYALRTGRAFTRAKWESYRSVRRRHGERAQRKGQVRTFRTVGDRELLRAMQWRYPRGQIATIGERVTTGRRGDRDLPTS